MHGQRRPELDRQLHLGHRRRRAPRPLRPRQVPRRDPADDGAAPARRRAGADQAGRARHEGSARQGRASPTRTRRCARRPARPSTTPRSSRCATCKARASQQQLKADFEAYLDGFSPNVQDILDKFEFRNQIPTLVEADALGTLIEKFLDPTSTSAPTRCSNGDGSVKPPGLDNHAMGTIFEELVRRFNEENNEEAGEHWTPRDAVKLMAKLIFLPIADQIESGTYLLYDGACGTGGMLTVAEETLQRARRRARQGGRHPPLRPGDQRRDLRHRQGRPAAQGRGRGGRQHRRRPGVLDALQRRLPVARVRLHALQSALRQELEERPGAHGRQGRHQGPALRHRARRRPGVLAHHPLQRRPDAVPGQHAVAR